MSDAFRPPPQPQKVAIFGSYAPSLTLFRGDLIADMIARGHEVYALGPDIEPATAAELRRLGATPVEVPLGRTSLNPLDAIRAQRALVSRLGKIRPDVLIAYTIKPIVLGARAAAALRIPRFVPMITGLGYSFLGQESAKRRLIASVARSLYRQALRNASVVLFQNADDRADFARMGLLATHVPAAVVNGSGIRLDRFRQKPLPNEPHFLMIARLLRDKGIREFAAAAARLKRERPNTRISLAGWRDESPDSIGQPELERMAADGIDFLGRLDDVRPALEACSVYVLPSYREGTPRSVLEALAIGRPVITTDAPGCRETVIPGKNGLLVPPRDADALYQAMLRLCDDAKLRARMAKASRRLAESKYDVREVNRTILELTGL